METTFAVGLVLALVFCGALGLIFVLLKRLNTAQKASENSLSHAQDERVRREVSDAGLRHANLLVEDLKNENACLRRLNGELEKQAASLLEREKALSEKAGEFEKFSARVFEDARAKFESSNKSQLDVILNPLKDDLKTFRKRMEDMNAEGELKRGSLENQIKFLGELNRNLSDEAANLAKALKGGNKTAGNWGELVLERLLESCGLREGFTFVREDSHPGDGGRLRPDVVVKLPEDKNFIIDSKVSLVHYEKYSSAQNDADAAAALKLFGTSVRNHIKELGSKKYENIEGLSNPDFVMMFIPIEPAFSLALCSDAGLLDFACANKIIMASPSTMLALLKTVETIWRNEKQNRNTLEIARQGGLLYDRVNIFVKKFEKFERSIKMLSDDYSEICTTVSGKRGVLNTADKLRELGVKAKGKIDSKLLEDASDAEE